MNNFSWSRLISVLVLAAIGVLLIIVGIKNTKSPTADYIETMATVTDVAIESVKDNNGLTREQQVVYVDYEVDGVKFTHKTYTKSGTYKQGDEVTVLYNPENPSEYVSEPRQGYGAFIIALGVIFIIGGAFLMFNKQSLKGKAKKK